MPRTYTEAEVQALVDALLVCVDGKSQAGDRVEITASDGRTVTLCFEQGIRWVWIECKSASGEYVPPGGYGSDHPNPPPASTEDPPPEPPAG